MRAPAGVRRLAWVGPVVAIRVSVERLLRREPLDGVLRALDREATGAELARATQAEVLEDILAVTARLLRNRDRPRTTCLHRALCRFALLRRAGFRPRFVLGVQATGPLEGHAWIELEGRPAGELSAPTCVPTFRYPT